MIEITRLNECNVAIGQERETMEEERMENLIEASRQVVEILQKNFHPHTTVVIEVDRIRVEETVEARVIEYAVD